MNTLKCWELESTWGQHISPYRGRQRGGQRVTGTLPGEPGLRQRAWTVDRLGDYWSWLLNKKAGHVQWTGMLKSVEWGLPFPRRCLIHSAPGDVFKFRYINSLSAWRSQGVGIFLEQFTLSPACIPLSLPTAAQTLPRCSGNTRLYWVRGHGYLSNGGFWMRCSKSVWWWTHLLGDWRII